MPGVLKAAALRCAAGAPVAGLCLGRPARRCARRALGCRRDPERQPARTRIADWLSRWPLARRRGHTSRAATASSRPATPALPGRSQVPGGPRGKWINVNPDVREPAELARLTRRGFWLEYASRAWMTVEAAVAIASGIIASSIALIGFGLDSVIEFAAAVIVIWQLRGGGEERESRAVRLIGVTFFVLACAVPKLAP